MRFIAHVFSIGRVGLYCSYKPQSRLIFFKYKPSAIRTLCG